MSLLNDTVSPPVNQADVVAAQLKEHLKQTYRYIVAAFTEGAQAFWANPSGVSAQDIAAALGTDGQEVFALHAQLGQFIASVKPEAVAAGLSFVGQFEYNADGSVTIVTESPTMVVPQQQWSPPPPVEPEAAPLPQQQFQSQPIKQKK